MYQGSGREREKSALKELDAKIKEKSRRRWTIRAFTRGGRKRGGGEEEGVNFEMYGTSMWNAGRKTEK